MNSHVISEFRRCFEALLERVQRVARQNYQLWKVNPRHPGIEFKRVSRTSPTHSVRIGLGWRALGRLENDTVVRFWIGSHADYDRFLRQQR